MKVLQVTNNYPTLKFPISGIFVKEQIDSLTKIGVDNKLFLINGREKGKLEYLRSVWRLRKMLKSEKFDLIHCHHSFSAVVLLLTGMAKNYPFIVSFQNDPSEESRINLFSIILKKADACILKNRSQLVDNKKVFYLPNGVNTDVFKPIEKKEACNKLGLLYEKKYILFVSSNFVRRQKRLDIYKDVVNKLKQYDNSVEELHLINTVRDLVPYYHNASAIHLLTSDFEGSPNSVKEALACNTPVVSTNVGNVKEMLDGVEGCYVAENNNVDELTRLCIKVLENKTQTNSRNEIIKKGYTMETVAEKIRDLYVQVIQNRNL